MQHAYQSHMCVCVCEYIKLVRLFPFEEFFGARKKGKRMKKKKQITTDQWRRQEKEEENNEVKDQRHCYGNYYSITLSMPVNKKQQQRKIFVYTQNNTINIILANLFTCISLCCSDSRGLANFYCNSFFSLYRERILLRFWRNGERNWRELTHTHTLSRMEAEWITRA